MSSTYALFLMLGFLAVFLLLEGLFQLWNSTRNPEVKRIRQRLRAMATGHAQAASGELVKRRTLSKVELVHEMLSLIPGIQRLDRLLLQASSSQTVAYLLATCLLAAMAGSVLATALHWTWIWGLVLVVGLASLPVLRLRWIRSRRLKQLSAQLPDALDLICRALRAGHAFSSALSMVGNEAAEPTATEFKTTFDEINFGISTKDALSNLAVRVPIADMRFFVMAVIIQLETGGNLAGLLAMLSNLIRERYKLFGKIRVLAAEGKLSAYILTALPFVVAGAIQVVNPGYMRILFTDPTGISITIGALCMMALGVFLLWRITSFRV
ncbi:MAG: type II secretion system F family protein [Rhodoferax sp.]